MTANFDPSCVPLDRALFLRLTDAAGTSVRCLDGCLWLTRDGSLEDCELAPGQSYLVEDDARVIVTAFGPSLAQVCKPEPRARAARRARPSPARSGPTPGLVATTRHLMRALTVFVLGLLSFNASADPKAGETKAQVCLLCHKPESAGIPLLEAQPARYLVAATMAFKKGTRNDQQMQANVARLSARDVFDIADYFASRGPMANRQTADAERVALGEAWVTELKCASCHQAAFSGRDLVPRLAGQSSGYLVSQLEAFAAGRRKHPEAQMPANDTRDIESIASYLATLR